MESVYTSLPDKAPDSARRGGAAAEPSTHYHYFRSQCSVGFDSEEGTRILDEWVSAWTSLLKKLYARHGKIYCDLTGGADSRVNLALVLLAGLGDKATFCTKRPEAMNCKRRYAVCEQDRKISSEILGFYKITDVVDNVEGREKKDFPYVMGLCSCFKTYANPLTREWASLDTGDERHAGFKRLMDIWLLDHPDADTQDKMQMAFEIAYYQWHDSFKLRDYARKGIFAVLPLADPQIKRLKSKGYRLWRFFMQRYCPELLQFPLQGRGMIDDLIRKEEAL